MRTILLLLLISTTLSGCLILGSEDARERPFDTQVESVRPFGSDNNRGCGGCS